MDYDSHKNDLRFLRRANLRLGAALVVLALILLVAVGGIFSLIGSERTVVVPPAIERTFWVTRDKASREYLEEMAAFVAWLVLDVSPSNVDWKRNVLLNYVLPAEHGVVKSRLDLEADRLRRNNASTSFLLQQLVADEASQSVVLLGRLRRSINGSDIGEPQTRRYRVQFAYEGGRIHVRSFKELDDETPSVRVGAVVDGHGR